MHFPELPGPKGRLLAVDDEKGSFGDLALQLVRLGVDVLFATAVDEAELLARQEGQALRGALIPSTPCVERVTELVDAIRPHTGIGPEAIAMLGRRLGEEETRPLRELGVRWRLWAPFEDRDLRFLGRALTWYSSDQNLRIDGRIPTALPATATRRADSREVLVGDLSRSGAHLEMDQPFPAGSMLRLEVALPGGSVKLRAMVRWVSGAQGGPLAARPRGCGVEFLRPSPAVLALLREHLDEEIDRFCL